MFEAVIETPEPDRVTKYRLLHEGSPLTYANVLDRWAGDDPFRSYFTSLLADSPFSAFRWETPMLTSAAAQRPFEFVLLNTPHFASRRTDRNTYADYFTDDDDDFGIVTFTNLGKNATLVAPSPRTEEDVYGHLAAFLRGAPQPQSDALWRIIGQTVLAQLSDKPIWLSTAGGGVAWLHVRLDSAPKYYGYAPYRKR